MADTVRSTVALSEVNTKSKLKEKEITVVHDQGTFMHETGDNYDGYFEAKKKDRSVKMHGPGVYTTAEGDKYSGVWDNDKLGANENVNISFVDGSIYEGYFKEWCYNGHAKFSFPDGAFLQCEFHENSPIGKLQLTDPNGHIWLGKAEQGYGWFNPLNHFFEILKENQTPIKIKRRLKVLKDDTDMPAKTAVLPEFMTKKSKVIVTSKSDVAGVTPTVSTSKK